MKLRAHELNTLLQGLTPVPSPYDPRTSIALLKSMHILSNTKPIYTLSHQKQKTQQCPKLSAKPL